MAIPALSGMTRPQPSGAKFDLAGSARWSIGKDDHVTSTELESEDRTMACRHLLGGTHPLCLAVQGLMTPSLWELQAYCATTHPSRCPLYQQHAATQEPVPLDAAVMLLLDKRPALRKPALRKPAFTVESSPLSGPPRRLAR